MSSYKDLSDNVDETFDFALRGKKYVMKYPTTGELEDIQVLAQKYDKLDDKTTLEAKDLEEQLTNAIYEYITPVDHDTKIKDAIRKENVKVLKKFNVMIREELAV